MNEDDFLVLWELQKSKEKESILFYLKANSYFGEFCDQTIYMIVYELLLIKIFEAGQIILSQAKRSPLNLDFRPYYQDRISKLGLKIKEASQEKGLKDNHYWGSEK